MPKRKTPVHQPRHQAAAEVRAANEVAAAAVKAAYLEFVEAGVYPGVDRLCKRLRMAKYIVENTRSALILGGLVPHFPSRYATWKEDDPFTEIPDDPDAAEVQARIEEARANREAASIREPLGVMTAKFHRPGRKHLAA